MWGVFSSVLFKSYAAVLKDGAGKRLRLRSKDAVL